MLLNNEKSHSEKETMENIILLIKIILLIWKFIFIYLKNFNIKNYKENFNGKNSKEKIEKQEKSNSCIKLNWNIWTKFFLMGVKGGSLDRPNRLVLQNYKFKQNEIAIILKKKNTVSCVLHSCHNQPPQFLGSIQLNIGLSLIDLI